MKKKILKILRYSGLPFFFREAIQRGKITILIFHDIDVDTGELVFNYLYKKYNIISLDEYVEASTLNKKLPNKALIITFDDGHVKNYDLLPIIKKYKIPITIFICSEIINTKRSFWFKYSKLNTSSEKYKKITNTERLEELKKIGFEQSKEYEEVQALNKKQIKEMSKYVDFQSHTMFHPCLHKCEKIEMYDEITLSKRKLEEEYEFRISSIAYPNGDYSDKVLDITQRAGYTSGLTVDFGFNKLNSNLFTLKRISTNDTTDINEFIVRVSGLWGFLLFFDPFNFFNRN